MSDAIERMNEDVESVNRWMLRNGMELNPCKKQTILIGNQRKFGKIDRATIPKISVNNVIINYSENVKYLGYSFNGGFDSSGHVGEIVKKVNFSLKKINHCKRYIPPDAKSRIVNGVILPLFDYGSMIYHGHGVHGTKNDERRIQVAHNAYIRFISRVSRFDRITPILNKMNLLNMFNRRQFLILCYVQKILGNGSAPYLNDIFIRNGNNTRAGLDVISLRTARINETGNKLLLSCSTCKMWNDLPIDIRNSKSHEIFRKSVHKYLLDKQKNDNKIFYNRK